MIGTFADRYGDARGKLGTRVARVLLAGTRPGVVANASLEHDRNAAVGIAPGSVWAGASRVTLGRPLLRRARQP